MAKKYFTWNFDDGLQQDKRIIEIDGMKVEI